MGLFDFLRKKNPEPLIFADNDAAFAHACLEQSYRVIPEEVIPAMVDERGRTGEDGELYFRIRIADRSGGKEIWGVVLRNAPGAPKAGDLVGFKVVEVATDVPEDLGIIGYIGYKFAPVFVEGKGWRIIESYIPENLKPTIRF